MCTSACSELIAHFGPISEIYSTFSSQPFNARRLLDRSDVHLKSIAV